MWICDLIGNVYPIVEMAKLSFYNFANGLGVELPINHITVNP
jgi:hypothetical protein